MVMIRSLMVLATVVCVAIVVPAAAQDSAPSAGRFQLAPGEGGSFVRLDTRTGAVSHCGQDKGVWHCEPILDPGLADRISALSATVDHLSAGLDGLSRRVDTLAAEMSKAASTADEAAPAPKGFAQKAVYRLLEMIRTLKHGRADQT